MPQLRAAALAAVIGLSVLGAAVAAEPLTSSADETEIRQLITEMTEGFNRHDGRAASSMYLPNATFVTARGETMEGRAAIEKGLTSIFETRAKNAALGTLNVTSQFLRSDIALAHVTNELSGLTAPDGQPLPSQQELSLRVLVKENGRWQVAAFHNTVIRPFTTTPR